MLQWLHVPDQLLRPVTWIRKRLRVVGMNVGAVVIVAVVAVVAVVGAVARMNTATLVATERVRI